MGNIDTTNPVEAAGMKAAAATVGQDLNRRADAVEHAMAEALEPVAVKSMIYTSGEEDPTAPRPPMSVPGRVMLMDQDPRLKKMPEAPTLMDFFKLRLRPTHQHMLQSASLALKNGCSEKVALACLLHDFSVSAFIQADHGYWGAQLMEPYVDEEVSWSIRYHQALRFFPDEANGYPYPETYVKFFGPNYKPTKLMHEAYEQARNHKWYMSARQVTINDIYSFDPTKKIQLEEFTDLIGRNFRQPKEGLGNDHSSSAHMWRTIIAPTRFL
jgi:hypothetical protein